MSGIKFTETILRDGHQSHIATRMTTKEIVPGLSQLDEVGYHALEVWGGATFDVCLRYLNENPWERLRTIRQHVKNTKLQMLLRGQNLLGYKHYPDDIVERFIGKSIENGIDIIRVFDALNDVRNLEKSIETINKEGGHCQGAISYTTSEIHTLDYFIQVAKDMVSIGADSVCIKDMAGVLTPDNAFSLVKGLKSTLDVPIEIHGHSTSGICEMTYLKAVEAGVDIIDTALSPFSGGTAQPATESLYEAIKYSYNVAPLDTKALKGAAKYYNQIKDGHISAGNFNATVMKIEPQILEYQVPGGMLSNLMSQLKAQNAGDRYEEVLQEIPRVRSELGYPPLVTPLSQMVGTQAVFNVLTGERYKVIPKEIKAYVMGQYGKIPGSIALDLQKTIIGEASPIECCPSDLLEDAFEDCKKDVADLTDDDEMVLAYAVFPDITETYLKNQEETSEEEGIHYIELMVEGMTL